MTAGLLKIDYAELFSPPLLSPLEAGHLPAALVLAGCGETSHAPRQTPEQAAARVASADDKRARKQARRLALLEAQQAARGRVARGGT